MILEKNVKRVFFDTNILLYTLSNEQRKAEIVEALLEEGGFISVQVLNEITAVARRKLKMSWEEISLMLTSIRNLCGPPQPLTVTTHEAAVKIAERYGYRIYDSSILASAIEAGCEVVYSEDMQGGQQIGGLTITNPFA